MFSCCIPSPFPGHPAIVSQGEVDELPDLTEAEQVMEKWPDLKGLGEESWEVSYKSWGETMENPKNKPYHDWGW